MNKRIFMLFLAFLAAFGAYDMATSREASAQVSVELVGKLGGESNYFDDEWLGDTKFGVSGGLRLSGLVRFANNVGVGLNFNWTMSEQRLKVKGLADALGDDSRRYVTIQHPSFGVNVRYMFLDMIDVGIWLNYAFGSADFDFVDPAADKEQAARDMNYDVGEKGHPNYVDTLFENQTFEFGILAHFRWYIPNTTCAVIVGAEFFMDFSAMEADDTRMHTVRFNDKKHLDETSMQSYGIQFVFGAGYDFYIDAFGKQDPTR